MPKPNWVCEQSRRNVFTLKASIQTNARWEFFVFLCSDLHVDSKHFDKKLFDSHAKKALARNAPILITGDTADAMQSRDDPRRSYDDLLPELKHGDYTTGVVRVCSRVLAPYAKNICLMSDGNHESSYRKKIGYGLVQGVATELNLHHGGRVFYGQYAGWFDIRFTRDTGHFSDSVLINYHHGSGYSKNTAAQRRGAMIPDARICTYGHTHERWAEYMARDRIGSRGVQFQDTQLHLGLGTYKNEYADGSSGYAVEKAHKVKPLGGWFVRCYWSRSDERVLFEPIPA